MKNVRAARMALIRIGEPVIPYLIQAIQKAHDGIAYEAGSLLQVIAKDKGRRILTQLSRDPVPEIRKRAAALLGRTKHAEQKAWAEALLLEALQDRNRGVREQAARSLGRLTIRSSVPQAIRLGPTPPRRILEQTAFPITDLPYGRSWSPPRVAQGTVTEVKKAGK
jgi:HEAT repeat protein